MSIAYLLLPLKYKLLHSKHFLDCFVHHYAFSMYKNDWISWELNK